MFNFWKKKGSQNDENIANYKGNDSSNLSEEIRTENFSNILDSSNNSERSIVSAIVRDDKQIVRGSKLFFSEDSLYNLELIRFLAPSSELVVETISLGNLAPKKVFLIYLGNIANLSIVAEVRKRVKAIKARTLYESSYIQRNIEDSNLSPFPQVSANERPDVAVSAMFQGRIVIILDGSPTALLAPCTFFDLLDTPHWNVSDFYSPSLG